MISSPGSDLMPHTSHRVLCRLQIPWDYFMPERTHTAPPQPPTPQELAHAHRRVKAGAQWVPMRPARSPSNCRTPAAVPRKVPGPDPEQHWVPGRERWPSPALPPPPRHWFPFDCRATWSHTSRVRSSVPSPSGCSCRFHAWGVKRRGAWLEQ